ncbi:MAG TPA: AI-2E family transporter [Candidatus Saccharimonadales bacterium]|nr:AI-2E family transporter [Candidatus Saccharimonadales bacterium]
MLIKNKVEVLISNRTIVRILGVIILVMLVLRFVVNVEHVLELIFIAFFLSLALNPVVSWISRQLHLKSRAAATGIAYIAVVVLLSAFVTAVVPPLAKQTVDFVRQAPATISSLKDENTSAGRFVVKYKLQDNIDGLSQSVHDHTKNFQEPVISTATKVGSAMLSILTVFVLTFMMLVEGPVWLRRYWKLHPKSRREHDQELAFRMYRIVTGYVNGQVILSTLAALITLVALLITSTILHVSINVVALAGIVFITGLIPMIGHIIGGVIVVFACLLVSVPLAIIIGLFILLHQQIENVTLQPYIQAKYNELTPLLVFIAALLGIGLGGLLGAFVAIPAAGCAKILAEDYVASKGISQE